MSGAVIRHVGVVVPAANEEVLLERCLLALRAARRAALARRDLVAVRIVLVLDGCTDGSRDIATAHPGIEIVEVDVRSVGPARRAGVAHLLGTGEPVPDTDRWIASTDADSVVPVNWLGGMLDAADRGAHLVLGTVVPDVGLAPAVDAAWHVQHPRHEDHPHVHGANLGIRADAYTALGGWPALATGEDQLLADRAAAAGHLHVERTGRFPVCTSSRLDGRAISGFSSYLRALRSDVADEGVA